LHRKDAKSAKKKEDFTAKNSFLPFALVFLCVLRVFAVQGFFYPATLLLIKGE
jgi:hypothetical protein